MEVKGWMGEGDTEEGMYSIKYLAIKKETGWRKRGPRVEKWIFLLL